MQNGKPTDRLVRFVEYLRNSGRQNGCDLTVLDLRLECRAQRLTEYPKWPAGELDLIECEAAGYGNEAILTQLLSGTLESTPMNADYSWLHSPSPVAWT